MTTFDIYQRAADYWGCTREEAKRRLYRQAYSSGPWDPKVKAIVEAWSKAQQ